jgi:hypothetical protein
MTRAMLLPLPASNARAMSLENHLALVAMRGADGNAELMVRLLRTFYLSYFLHEAVHGRTELQPFREVEAVLLHSVSRGERNEGWALSPADSAILGNVLTLHDQQLASIPVHVLEVARVRLQRFAASDLDSPIPREKAGEPSGHATPFVAHTLRAETANEQRAS